MSNLLSMWFLVFFVAMFTLTVSRSKAFRFFRDWVDDVTAKDGVSEPSAVYELIKCPYCLSFWVTGASIVVFPSVWRDWAVTNELKVYWVADLALRGAMVWGLSCVVMGAITQLLTGGGFKND